MALPFKPQPADATATIRAMLPKKTPLNLGPVPTMSANTKLHQLRQDAVRENQYEAMMGMARAFTPAAIVLDATGAPSLAEGTRSAIDGVKAGKYGQAALGLGTAALGAADLSMLRPRKVPVSAADKGIQELRDITETYANMANATAPNTPAARAAQRTVNPTRGAAMAEVYAGLPNTPEAPDVQRAYKAFARETEAQRKWLEQWGYGYDVGQIDPYPNSKAMVDDARKRKRIQVFATGEGQEHPLLTNDQNDAFRGVHDLWGHAAEGFQFGAAGEENAALKHAASFSDEARQAMLTETRGQNSYVNFGPNKDVPVADRPFAPQKSALWPKEYGGDYTTLDGGMSLVAPKGPRPLRDLGLKAGANALSAAAGSAISGEGDPLSAGLYGGVLGAARSVNPALARAAKRVAKSAEPVMPNELPPPDIWTPPERGIFAPRGEASDRLRPGPLPFATADAPRTPVDPLAERIGNDPRVLKRILQDAKRGERVGGLPWYDLRSIADSYGDMKGPLTFNDFAQAGAAGSARTGTANELANSSLLLYAKRNGLTAEEARQEFFRRFPGTEKPTFMGMHETLFDRAQKAGYNLPDSPTHGALKVPNYGANRMGFGSGVPLDTHEMRMIAQAIGSTKDEVAKAAGRNARSYEAMTQPYKEAQKALGYDHLDQVQASRWLGGGPLTGLKSQPVGDFRETLERGLHFTARARGLDESPKGLRGLWQRIAQGEDFFLPYGREGGFPLLR